MGFSLSGGSSPNSGLIFAPLRPIDDRTKLGKGHGAKDIVADVAPKLFGVPGGLVAAFEPPAIQGIGAVGGFQFMLQDQGRNTFGDIASVVQTMVGQTRAPGAQLTGLYSPYTANDPQIAITIDREKAKAIGVPVGSGLGGDGDVHGIELRERLRLQQPVVPRLCAGGPTVSAQCAAI